MRWGQILYYCLGPNTVTSDKPYMLFRERVVTGKSTHRLSVCVSSGLSPPPPTSHVGGDIVWRSSEHNHVHNQIPFCFPRKAKLFQYYYTRDLYLQCFKSADGFLTYKLSLHKCTCEFDAYYLNLYFLKLDRYKNETGGLRSQIILVPVISSQFV